MLPLTTITSDGKEVSPDIFGFFDRLDDGSFIDGFMVDVWWGLTEPSPQAYVWDGYRKLFDLAKQRKWKVQIVASFHQCGGNIGDDCFIPVPSWIPRDQSLWYKDQNQTENFEYISLWADNVKIEPKPLSCPEDDAAKVDCGFAGVDAGGCAAGGCCWAESSVPGGPWCFNSTHSTLPPVPCPPSRTPVEMYSDWFAAFEREFSQDLGSTIVEVMVGLGPAGELRYPSYPLKYWNFCGVGEFQCFDDNALASLRSQANSNGRSEWGSPFSRELVGNYNSQPPSATRFFQSLYQQDQGAFFLDWYFDSLKSHGARVLSAANAVFGSYAGVKLAGKIAGIHWWYGDQSHAAEVTAGYYNTNFRNGYAEIADTFKASGNVTFCFTCLEMRNFEQSSSCNSVPESLVLQTKEAALGRGIPYAGENALPRYDRAAYDQIVSWKQNMEAFTYLRLNPTLLDGQNFDEFKRFVFLMHTLCRLTLSQPAFQSRET